MVLGLICAEWEAKAEAVKAKAVPALLNLMGKRSLLTLKICATGALMQICVDICGKAAAIEDGAVPLIIDALQARTPRPHAHTHHHHRRQKPPVRRLNATRVCFFIISHLTNQRRTNPPRVPGTLR